MAAQVQQSGLLQQLPELCSSTAVQLSQLGSTQAEQAALTAATASSSAQASPGVLGASSSTDAAAAAASSSGGSGSSSSSGGSGDNRASAAQAQLIAQTLLHVCMRINELSPDLLNSSSAGQECLLPTVRLAVASLRHLSASLEAPGAPHGDDAAEFVKSTGVAVICLCDSAIAASRLAHTAMEAEEAAPMDFGADCFQLLDGLSVALAVWMVTPWARQQRTSSSSGSGSDQQQQQRNSRSSSHRQQQGNSSCSSSSSSRRRQQQRPQQASDNQPATDPALMQLAGRFADALKLAPQVPAVYSALLQHLGIRAEVALCAALSDQCLGSVVEDTNKVLAEYNRQQVLSRRKPRGQSLCVTAATQLLQQQQQQQQQLLLHGKVVPVMLQWAADLQQPATSSSIKRDKLYACSGLVFSIAAPVLEHASTTLPAGSTAVAQLLFNAAEQSVPCISNSITWLLQDWRACPLHAGLLRPGAPRDVDASSDALNADALGDGATLIKLLATAVDRAAGSSLERGLSNFAAGQLCSVVEDYLRTGIVAQVAIGSSSAQRRSFPKCFEPHGMSTVAGLVVGAGHQSGLLAAVLRHIRGQQCITCSACLQLYGLLSSMLKLGTNGSGCSRLASSSVFDQQQGKPTSLLLQFQHAACHAAGQVLQTFSSSASAQGPSLSSGVAAMPAEPEVPQSATEQQFVVAPVVNMSQRDTDTADMFPWLALLGRVLLQWGLQLQQLHRALAQAHGPLGIKMALSDCMQLITGIGTVVERLTSVVAESLQRPMASPQLAGWGYDVQAVHVLRQQLLDSTRAASEAHMPLCREDSVSSDIDVLDRCIGVVWQQLQAFGSALACFAHPHACNNPVCGNVAGPSEAALVGGRSCICAGCRTARYCSRACQKVHSKQHKPVCKALAAAAAAALTGGAL